MTTLPRAIAPWSEQLAIFPPELAVELGGVIRRLSLAIGPLRARDGHGMEDPDGFSGLTRRGSYERLLTSEWLLAEEAPEEFIRRAAMREHAFFALSHRSPAGTRRSVALFDAGPSQLGAPRLAHLALLIVLARRAAEAKVEFAWGILQDEEASLQPTIDAVSIKRLLSARTARSPDQQHFLRWQGVLGAPTAGDDLWLVGGDRLGGPEAASRVAVEDPLAPGERRLEVRVRPARRAPRSVSLPLPSSAASVRLLRDPFEVAAGRPLGLGDQRPTELRFDPSGHRLIVLHAGGEATVYPVPNSPRDNPGNPRRLSIPSEERLVAVGAYRKSLLALAQAPPSPHQLLFRGSHQLLAGAETRFDLTELPFVPPTSPAPMVFLKPSHSPTAMLFLDGGGTLFLRSDGGAARPIARAVTAMTTYLEGLLAIADSYGAAQPGRWILRVEARSGIWDQLPGLELPQGDGDLKAFFGVGDHPMVGGLAVRCHADRWKVFTRSGNLDLVPPSGAEVVGVVNGSLLLLENERTTLSLVGLGRSSEVLRSSSPLLQVTASTGAANVAYLNARGEIAIHSIPQQAEVFRLLPGGAG